MPHKFNADRRDKEVSAGELDGIQRELTAAWGSDGLDQQEPARPSVCTAPKDAWRTEALFGFGD